MPTISIKTKNHVNVGKKPRVYFTCHPEDFEQYFTKICEDIFKTHDCAIYYTKDMIDNFAEDEKKTDLARNNLFVVPVTFKLLSTPNRAMDEDIPYAKEKHIPILPFMMESGIDEVEEKVANNHTAHGHGSCYEVWTLTGNYLCISVNKNTNSTPLNSEKARVITTQKCF